MAVGCERAANAVFVRVGDVSPVGLFCRLVVRSGMPDHGKAEEIAEYWE